MSDYSVVSCVGQLLRERRSAFDFGFHSRVGKGRSGLYAFWSGSACLYVGKSTDIGRRLYGHRMQEHNTKLDQFFRAFSDQIEVSVVSQEECGSADLLSLEGYFIRTFRPLTNGVVPR